MKRAVISGLVFTLSVLPTRAATPPTPDPHQSALTATYCREILLARAKQTTDPASLAAIEGRLNRLSVLVQDLRQQSMQLSSDEAADVRAQAGIDIANTAEHPTPEMGARLARCDTLGWVPQTP